jgi:hypothetical protein
MLIENKVLTNRYQNNSFAVGFGMKKREIDVITIDEVNNLIQAVNSDIEKNTTNQEMHQSTEEISVEEYNLLLQQNEKNQQWWAQEVEYNGKKMSRRIAMGLLQRLYYFEQQKEGHSIAECPHTVHYGQLVCVDVLKQLEQLPCANKAE